MRKTAILFFLATLISLPSAGYSQQSNPFDDPFDDPFGGDPFANPAADRQPSAQQAAKDRARANAKATKSIGSQNQSEATLRIRAALDDRTTQSFVELPLEDAIQVLADTHDIPVVVDRRALEEIGIAPNEPVNLSLKNVSLRSFLRLMLRELDLTYIIKDEVMQITTLEAAEQNLVVEMYKFPKELVDKSDKVISALTASVNPATWEVLGGPSSVSAIENVLIVSATESTHDHVRDFLEKLEEAFQAYKAKQ